MPLGVDWFGTEPTKNQIKQLGKELFKNQEKAYVNKLKEIIYEI